MTLACYNSRPQTIAPLPAYRAASSFCCTCYPSFFVSRDPQVQEALSAASQEEAPFGALDLCVEGYGESRAMGMLDDYLSMGEVDFARCVFVGWSCCWGMPTRSLRGNPGESF